MSRKRHLFGGAASPRPPKRTSSSLDIMGQTPSADESTQPHTTPRIEKYDFFETASSPSETSIADLEPANYSYTNSSLPPQPSSQDDPVVSSIQLAMDQTPAVVSPMLQRYVDEMPAESALKSPAESPSKPPTEMPMADNNIEEPYPYARVTQDVGAAPVLPRTPLTSYENFAQQPPNVRQGLYAQFWSGNDLELKDLKLPPECSIWPSLAEEILEAYLSYTTVIVKVWTNYDSVLKLITLHPGVVRTAGTIYLTPHQRANLRSIDQNNRFQLQNVRFDIGTPFHTLFSCLVQALSDEATGVLKLKHRVHEWDDPCKPNKLLLTAIRGILATDFASEEWEGYVGLMLADVERIANKFYIKPALFSGHNVDLRDIFETKFGADRTY